MDRIIFSIAAFVAVFCSVVVGTVLLSLGGWIEVSAPVAYGLAVVIAIDTARRIHGRGSGGGASR